MNNKIALVGNADSIHFVRYVNFIKKLNYDVYVISPVRSAIVKVDLLVVDYYSKNLIKKIKSTVNVVRFVKSKNLNYVHYHFFSYPSIEALFINIIQYATIWGGDIFYVERFKGHKLIKQIKRLILKLMFSRITKVFTHSKYVQKYLKKEYKIPEYKIHLFPFLSSEISIRKIVKQHLMPFTLEDKHIVLSPRAIKPLYNIMKIIDSFVQLPKDYILILKNYVPKSDYYRKVIERIHSLKVEDRVFILDNLNEEENRYLVELADVVISLASSDMISISIIEALQNYKPVVLFRLPSYEEEFVDIDGVTFLDNLDSKAVAEVIITSQKVKIDKFKYNKIIDFYSMENIKKMVGQIYE